MTRSLPVRLLVALLFLSHSSSVWAQLPTTAPAATQAAEDAQLPDDAAVEAKLNEHLPEVRYKAVPLSQELAKRVVTRTYTISDLLRNPPGLPGAGGMKAPITVGGAGEIERYITENVDTDSWKDNGGNDGEIKFDAPKHALIIRQSPETHRKIAAVLAALRDASSTKALRSTTQP